MTKARSSARPNRREIAAEATRSEILRAARRLFAGRGYAATSIVELAEEAGVSVPTLYASVGTKKDIVLALAKFIGEESGAQEGTARIETETDPRALLAIAARINRSLVENCSDILASLMSAAHVEPDVARAVTFGRQIHRHGAEQIARRLHALGAVDDVTEATDVIDLMTDIECFGKLVRACGWSFDRAEEWITQALATLLFGPRARARRER